jgi:hypothetical protein
MILGESPVSNGDVDNSRNIQSLPLIMRKINPGLSSSVILEFAMTSAPRLHAPPVQSGRDYNDLPEKLQHNCIDVSSEKTLEPMTPLGFLAAGDIQI